MRRRVPPRGWLCRPGCSSSLLTFGRIEGISLLVLFGIAMPLKYGTKINVNDIVVGDLAVSIVGGIHGGLFIIFVLLLLLNWRRERWPLGLTFLVGLSSSIPFGFVWAERKLSPERHGQLGDATADTDHT